jgi:hypothetical protein
MRSLPTAAPTVNDAGRSLLAETCQSWGLDLQGEQAGMRQRRRRYQLACAAVNARSPEADQPVTVHDLEPLHNSIQDIGERIADLHTDIAGALGEIAGGGR